VALLSFLERAIFVIKSRTINIYGSVGSWYDTNVYGEMGVINIYGSVGSWYDTNVYGEMGVIHSSQIKFDN